MNPPPRLAVFLSFSGAGGVERMVLNLLEGILELGIQVDLLAVMRKPIPELTQIAHPGFRLLDLGTRHTALALPGLIRYLKTERPEVMLVAKDRAIRVAVLARFLAGIQTRIVGRLGTNLSAALDNKPPLLRWLRTAPIRFIYRSVDAIVAVSQGVAEDTLKHTGLPQSRVHAIPNPVITGRFHQQRQITVNHPWLSDSSIPVIMGAGRLTAQKDFTTLLQAFAKVRQQRESRLILLGDGAERNHLEQLASRLGIADSVCFVGHQANPYAWMARASLFVLSSRWEGTANVLTEALALGIPVVATDRPSGPRETLVDGHYGSLVTVGDSESMAQAMLDTLAHPLAPAVLQQAVSEFSAERSARRYLEVLGYRSCT